MIVERIERLDVIVPGADLALTHILIVEENKGKKDAIIAEEKITIHQNITHLAPDGGLIVVIPPALVDVNRRDIGRWIT